MRPKTPAKDPMFTAYTFVFVVVGVIVLLCSLFIVKHTGAWIFEELDSSLPHKM